MVARQTPAERDAETAAIAFEQALAAAGAAFAASWVATLANALADIGYEPAPDVRETFVDTATKCFSTLTSLRDHVRPVMINGVVAQLTLARN